MAAEEPRSESAGLDLAERTEEKQRERAAAPNTINLFIMVFIKQQKCHLVAGSLHPFCLITAGTAQSLNQPAEVRFACAYVSIEVPIANLSASDSMPDLAVDTGLSARSFRALFPAR